MILFVIFVSSPARTEKEEQQLISDPMDPPPVNRINHPVSQPENIADPLLYSEETDEHLEQNIGQTGLKPMMAGKKSVVDTQLKGKESVPHSQRPEQEAVPHAQRSGQETVLHSRDPRLQSRQVGGYQQLVYKC